MQNERSDGGMGKGLEENLEPVIEQSVVEDVEPEKYESVEDSVRRSIQEVKAKEEPQEQDIEQPVVKAEPVKQVATTQPKPIQQVQGNKSGKQKEIEPPGSYKLEEKEDFNRLPPKQKEAVKRVVAGYREERDQFLQEYRKEVQTIQAERQHYKDYESLVKDRMPEWGLQGMTPIQVVAGLVKAQSHILNNPKEAMRNLVAQTGVTAQDLFGEDEPATQNSSYPDITNHPVVKKMIDELTYLRASVEPVNNERISAQEAEFNAGVDRMVNEISLVRNEKDNYGRYLYPKLHDNDFLKSVNSLALDIQALNPTLSLGDSIKRAYSATVGNVQNVVRPQTITNVVRTGQPLRGTGSGFSKPVNLETPSKVEDSVRAAIEQLKSGQSY